MTRSCRIGKSRRMTCGSNGRPDARRRCAERAGGATASSACWGLDVSAVRSRTRSVLGTFERCRSRRLRHAAPPVSAENNTPSGGRLAIGTGPCGRPAARCGPRSRRRSSARTAARRQAPLATTRNRTALGKCARAEGAAEPDCGKRCGAPAVRGRCARAPTANGATAPESARSLPARSAARRQTPGRTVAQRRRPETATAAAPGLRLGDSGRCSAGRPAANCRSARPRTPAPKGSAAPGPGIGLDGAPE